MKMNNKQRKSTLKKTPTIRMILSCFLSFIAKKGSKSQDILSSKSYSLESELTNWKTVHVSLVCERVLSSLVLVNLT